MVVERFPEDFRYRPALARLLLQFAMLLSDTGRPAQAEPVFQEALNVCQQVVEDSPAVPEHREDLARLHFARANAFAALHRPADQEAALHQAISIYEQLSKKFPEEPDYSFKAASSRNSLGAMLMNQERRGAQAEEQFRSARVVLDKLAEQAPANAEYQHVLGGIKNNVAMLLNRRWEFAPARELLKQAINHQQAALRVNADNKSYRQFLRNHYDNLAETLVQLGEHAAAVETLRQALKLDPNYGRVLNNLACLLAACPDKAVRDPAEAVRLAKKAVAVAPSHADHLNTLGVALYQAGNLQEAVDTLDKSVTKRKGGDSYDFFFLAMAHWQLGHHEDARQWYTRAVEWMDKNRPNDNDLRRFRAEAAALLDIADAPKPPTGPRPDP
jgi:tetratricopeptide (TPR) repeat protein